MEPQAQTQAQAQAVIEVPNGNSVKSKKVKWIAPSVVDLNDAENNDAKDLVFRYLERFGYMQQQTLDKKKDLSSALSLFQNTSKVTNSGVYDEATRTLMNLPRCGVQDKHLGTKTAGRFPARFVVFGDKWSHTNITYSFENFTPDLTPAKVRQIIQSALARWEAITPLSFTEVTTGEDITIRFVTGDHGDGIKNAFDGPGNVLAHAWPPTSGFSGDTHFDEDEGWTEFQLAQVALHEFGHALGLDHSTVPAAAMWPYYDGSHPELHEDDMAGIHSIYGWRDPRWEQLDNSAATIAVLASGNQLYKLHNNGLVFQYIGPPFTGWKLINNQPNTVKIVCGVSGNLYQRRSNGEIARYNNNPMDWSLIDANPDCVDIVAGGAQLYQRHREGAIYRYSGPGGSPQWELIDDNPRTIEITAAENGLFQRHNNGDLWRYIGPGIKWDLLRNNTAAGGISAASDKLYQLNGHDIWEWSWSGGTTRAQVLDRNPATVGVFARGTHLYQVHNSGKIWRYTGTPFSGWELIDDFSGTKDVVGSENGEVFQRHSDGHIWRLAS